MTFKRGVQVRGVRPEIVLAIQTAATLWPDLVVTSVTDGRHSLGSLHYVGAAFDIRTRDFADVEGAADDLRSCLTNEYDVVVEPTHMHVEFQPKKPL